jgi:CHAT domain-containing protein
LHRLDLARREEKVGGGGISEKVADDARVDEFLASFVESEIQQVFHLLIEILVAQDRPEEAFDYAERARARMILQQLGNPRLRPERNADPRLVSEAEALRVGIADLERQAAFTSAAERERLSSDLRHARQRYQSLLVRLKVSNRRYDARLRVEPLSAARVRAELPPDTTLVSYFVSSAGPIHAWVLDREALQYLPLPVGPEQLRRAVCWAEEVGRGAGDRSALRLDPRCQAESASAEELYEGLITALPGTGLHSRLILIPHGDLHYIPFAALRNPRSGRFLIEDHTLIYTPSASALRYLRTLETPVAGRALVLGDPASEATGRRALAAAKKEATFMAHLFGTEPMLGCQAKECLLQELGGQVDLLHIAAHGIYEPEDPLFSRLGLAPSQGYDGNLEVHEILSGLDLSGVNLVVLAACSTAAGERSGGDDVVGLTRAFLYAGSPGVISALWAIDDDASALLMGELYSGLLVGGSAAEALRQAQLAMLRTQSYRAPYFWAAFSLTGDPQARWQNSALR